MYIHCYKFVAHFASPSSASATDERGDPKLVEGETGLNDKSDGSADGSADSERGLGGFIA